MIGNIKSLIWAGTAVFFHFSFLFACAILILFILLRNRLNIYFGFFIITIFLKEIDIMGIQSILTSVLPDVFHNRIETYARPEYAEAINLSKQSNSWFLSVSEIGMRVVNYTVVIFIYLSCRGMLKERRDLTTLLCFSLLIYGFTNIFSQIPSGGRFYVISNSLMFAFYILFYTSFPKTVGLKFILSIASPIIALFSVLAIRIGMEYFGLMTILSNPFIAPLYKDTVPLIEVIKGML